MCQRMPKLYLMLAAKLTTCQSHHAGNGFEGMDGLWKATEAWYCKRSVEDIGKVAASVAAKGPGLKGSCKEVES